MSSTLRVNELQNLNGTSAFTIDSSGRMLKGTGGQLPAFRAYPSANFNTSSGAYTILTDNSLVFGLTLYNYGGHYNASTGRFVAPVSGLYQFTALMAMNSNSNTYVYLSAEIHTWDGTSNSQIGRYIGGWGHKQTSSPAAYDRQINLQTIYVDAGDSVSMGYEITTAGVPVLGSTSAYTTFSGYLIG